LTAFSVAQSQLFTQHWQVKNARLNDGGRAAFLAQYCSCVDLPIDSPRVTGEF